MALQTCGLKLSRAARELQPHGSLAFPCAGYAARYTEKQEDIIPWHWHEEMEIIYIAAGRMRVRIPQKTFLLSEGDCLILNANTLHYAVAAPECELHSLVFSPALITGGDSSAFAKRYIQPLLSCRAFSGYYAAGKGDRELARCFGSAFEALAGDRYGFEFIVRENLSRICLFLHGAFGAQINAQSSPQGRDELRIRKMLAYIQKNFAEELSLSDIAKEADIGERECLRCFQRTIQLSPIQYLLKYRVMQGAELLVTNPSYSIAEIAAFCGFDSQSNFAKTFRRFYSCTPREYRSRSAE